MNYTYLRKNCIAAQELRKDLKTQENKRNQEKNMDFFQIFRVSGFAAVCKCSSNLLYFKIYLNRVPE